MPSAFALPKAVHCWQVTRWPWLYARGRRAPGASPKRNARHLDMELQGVSTFVQYELFEEQAALVSEHDEVVLATALVYRSLNGDGARDEATVDAGAVHEVNNLGA